MEYKEFFKRLGERTLSACLLMHGPEEYIKERALSQLRAAYLPEGLEAMNETLLEASASEDAILENCEMLPFMGEKRLVIVRDHPLVTAGKAAGEGGRLTDFIKAPPDHVLLVFYVRGQADGRKRVAQAITKAGGAAVFAELADGDLFTYLRRECGALGKKPEKEALEQLVLTCGRDLTILSREVDKLCAYVGAREEVSARDVEAVATPTLESNVFRFVDSIVEKKAQNALEMQKRLLRDGESPLMILAVMARAFRQLHHARVLLDAGVARAQIEKAIGVSGFIAARVLKQAQAGKTAWLGGAVNACIEADYLIKSGGKREDAALSDLVLTLLR